MPDYTFVTTQAELEQILKDSYPDLEPEQVTHLSQYIGGRWQKSKSVAGEVGMLMTDAGFIALDVAFSCAPINPIGVVRDGRAMFKTAKHLAMFEVIEEAFEKKAVRCTCRSGADEKACEMALSYVLRQKNQKAGKRVAGAAGLGPLLGLYAVGKMAYKSAQGTLSVKRMQIAEQLYVGARENHCPMASIIVRELCGAQKANAIIVGRKPDRKRRSAREVEAIKLIADKLKSN